MENIQRNNYIMITKEEIQPLKKRVTKQMQRNISYRSVSTCKQKFPRNQIQKWSLSMSSEFDNLKDSIFYNISQTDTSQK